jgi:hypothetical protein
MLRVSSNFAWVSPLLRLLSNPACPAGAVVCFDADTVATDAAPHGDIESQTAGHFGTVISSVIGDR